MELAQTQIDKLKQLFNEWSKNKDFELEVTFGQGGTVDSNTFISIAQRLKSKGMAMNTQEDYLNIITPKGLRVTLNSLGIVQTYCKDDSLTDKEYKIIRKGKVITDSNLDVAEYNLRFKIRGEQAISNDDPEVTEMISNWSRQPKAFRLIRRWSFEYKSVRFDLSMIRQTPTEPGKGEYQWVNKFLQKNVLQQPPRYEVEVELLRTATPENALKDLISAVGEVQRAIQKNTLLIRNSVINTVRAEYKSLVGSDKFRGVGPVTLQLQNMTKEIIKNVANIREGYNVTDKADGLRSMGYVNKDGELFLIDQSMNIYRTGLKNPICANSLVDGEWVTKSKDDTAINHFLLFDIYIAPTGRSSGFPFVTFKDIKINEEREEKDANGKKIVQEKIIKVLDTDAKSRYNILTNWFENWKKDENIIAKGITASNRLIIALKTFKFGNIFSGCAEILNNSGGRMYHTDGLIITSNNEPLPDREGVRFENQFKWKPSKDNTVDFLVNFERDTESVGEDKIYTAIHPTNSTIVRYKTMRLYVGGAKSSADDNPRQAVLMEEPILKENERNIPYKPILFNPVDFPDTMANICNISIEMNNESLESFVSTHDTKEPISDRSVIEMRYDPSQEPGWRWIPARIRHDKTERLLRAVAKGGIVKYSGTMNDTSVANSVWNSIHDPVTESMIRTGKEEPTEEEMQALLSVRETDITKKYYERKAPKEDISFVRGLLDFHNKYIKNKILLESVLKGGNKKVIDLACGKAGDLNKWHFNHAAYVIGIDTAGENITNSSDGAYKRYVELIRKFGRSNVPNIAFAIGNSSKKIVDGTAGANPEERDILRSIFGRIAPEGTIPPYISRNMINKYRDGADVAACMFALHYFFESKETLNGFIQNLADTVAYGGYFVGCCFDGDEVFRLLRHVEKGNFVNGTEGDIPIWNITKEYDMDELRPDESSIGLPINVEFISIGTAHREYLVSFKFLEEKMKSIGFYILDSIQCRDLGLKKGSNLFKDSYDMSKKEGKNTFNMPSESVRQFSFLNRWFIFKRRELISPNETIPSKNNSQVPDAKEEEDTEALIVVENPKDKELHFGPEITRDGPHYKKYIVVKSSSYSVLKPWQEKEVTQTLRNWVNPQKILYVVDGTAHIGMDSINLSNVYTSAKIHSYEVVPEIFDALVKNIKIDRKEGKIIPHQEDITSWTPPDEKVGILYLDPPWGGEDYLKKQFLDLYLQPEGEEPNEDKNIVNLISKWNATNRIDNIIVKVPKNFNKRPLEDLFVIQEAIVHNRSLDPKKNTAYKMILIRNQIQKTKAVRGIVADKSVVPDAIEAKEEAKEEEKVKDDAIKLKLRFNRSEICYIGDDAQVDEQMEDNYAGKWLALSAHFPIIDQTDSNIKYPSIEHYLSAMKIKNAGYKDRAILWHDFTDTGKIHSEYLRLLKNAKPETPNYYKIIKAEGDKVRLLLKTNEKYHYDSTKWSPIANGHLEYAIKYRLDHDARFIKCINKAAEHKKYILYLSNDNDLGGILDNLSLIKGNNKVGKMIMKLSGNPVFDNFKLD